MPSIHRLLAHIEQLGGLNRPPSIQIHRFKSVDKLFFAKDVLGGVLHHSDEFGEVDLSRAVLVRLGIVKGVRVGRGGVRGCLGHEHVDLFFGRVLTQLPHHVAQLARQATQGSGERRRGIGGLYIDKYGVGAIWKEPRIRR